MWTLMLLKKFGVQLESKLQALCSDCDCLIAYAFSSNPCMSHDTEFIRKVGLVVALFALQWNILQPDVNISDEFYSE